MLNLRIDSDNIEHFFDQIAIQLFNEYAISTGSSFYQATELEFYYNNTSQTMDNFAHDHRKKEYKNGTWRLHGAGVDIVLKNETHYGGILIRGIQLLNQDYIPVNEGYIDGPWNTIERLIQQKGIVETQSGFYLCKLPYKKNRAFKKTPRVGLNLRNIEDLEYICKPWRYITTPIQTQRCRELIFLQLHFNEDEEKNTLGLSERTKANYLNYFQEGQNMALDLLVKKPKSVAKNCQLFGHYIKKYSK
ncbi:MULTISPECIES: hypothetical protein [unclassified Aureispira]|uniref:hypothetical protein n=1 Tax=unclassified Aureispira TaxID=2649989 RepID=UPI000696B424|nr:MULTISPECIES: hypothetical protein [unclassified Aureispira]WMX14962.1 hypothetical protein QP953_01100 [Aureispira sp. CCB-E]